VKPNLRKVLPHLNVSLLRELAAALTAAGHTQDEVIEQVVAAVDACISWDKLGPVGAAWEVVDGPVITAFVKLLLHHGKRHE
jgi:hypothetical protein